MNPPRILRIAISDEVLQRIFKSDQDMYPAPLTYEQLKGWVDGCPELCVCFRACPDGTDANLVGAIIVLPLLKRHWEDVLVGKLKETDIEPAMFAGETDTDVGLHIFHIERFDGEMPDPRLPRFAEFALNDIRKLIEKKAWNILGYSALTATIAGRRVFRRMDFKATGYEELFVTNTNSEASGATIEMICVYPNGGDRLENSGDVHSRSEMVVRYQKEDSARMTVMEGNSYTLEVTPGGRYRPIEPTTGALTARLPPVHHDT